MFILIFLLGFSLLNFSKDFKITEKFALAMPIGFGLTSFIMYFLDRTIHSITTTGIEVSVSLSLILFVSARLYLDWKANDLPWKRPRPKVDLSWLTLVWVIFAGMITTLVYGICVKGTYWPTHDFDAILGYDLLSKAIAHEHTLANSVMTTSDIVNNCGPRLLYPPLFALSNSLAYFDGLEIPGLVTSLFFISWAFTCYALLRRFVSSSGAIIFTFLTIIIPEMFYRASVCGTNLPCSIYTSIAVMSFVVWYEQRKEGFFYLSLLAVMFGTWTRSEAVLFAGGILVILLYVAVREKRFKYLFIYFASLIPLVLWNLFLKAFVPRDQTGIFILKPFYDAAKLKKILTIAWEIMSTQNYYGITFYIAIAGFFLIVIANIATNFGKKENKILLGGLVLWLVIYLAVGANLFSIVLFAILVIGVSYVNGDKWEFLVIFFIALGAYTMTFYQMKDEQNALFGPGGWIQSGYKRGLFNYAPLGLFILVTSRWVSWAFGKLDAQLELFKRKA